MIIKDKQAPEERTPLRDQPEDAENIDQLVARARDGDDDAFGEIVSLYERFVFNTVCRVLSASDSSLSDADDAVQAAFIKAWRNLSSFRGECSFATWLFRIAVNCTRDMLRSAGRRKTVSLTREDDDGETDEWDLPETNTAFLPEENLERRERADAVRRAVEQLPEDQRQVLVLRDLHELPYTQISEMLSLELGTVKSRLNRARRNLKNILKNGNFL